MNKEKMGEKQKNKKIFKKVVTFAQKKVGILM